MQKLKHFTIPKDKTPCIYGIINPIDLKIYIGATKNPNKRATMHKSQLLNGKHPNKELQKDIEKGLRFFIIYKIPPNKTDNILIYEKIFMLKVLETGYKLYNIANAENQEKIIRKIIFDLLYKVDDNYKISFKNALKMDYWNLRILKDKSRYL